jgi:hypothetical protein
VTNTDKGFAPLLIHIGLHKTGSTWLQRTLFKDASRGFTDETGEHRSKIIDRFVRADPLLFDPTEIAAHYADARAAANEAGLTFVLSHERLSGHPSSGSFDSAIIAERLNKAFPDARVLIVIREQRALIGSMYGLHVRWGGVESVRRYLIPAPPRRGFKPGFTLQAYEFDRLIGHYQKLFGKDRVLVLPLELLARDDQEFADRIGTFCGHASVPVGRTKRRNVRRPQLMQMAQRPLNMLFYHNELSPGALFHIPRFKHRYAKLTRLFRLSPQILERRLDERQKRAIDELVGDHYAASNGRTQEMTGLPLSELGYPVR